MLLMGALVALSALVTALIILKPQKAQEPAGPDPEDQLAALVDQAQAALESERFEEAARLSQQAIDKDPIAQAPRKVLATARREQQNQKAYADAMGKAQVGREDEALALLGQVSPQSRFFARARIKARDLAQTVLRTRGSACRTAPRSNAQEIADECGKALDVKCQMGSVDDDPMLKALRAAERSLPRRVPWSCPQQLAALFRDEGADISGPTLDEKLLTALYPDATVRAAIASYARGDVPEALRKMPRRPELAERIKVVDGRFREGQTAIMGGALDRADTLWGEALQADSALMPAGVESFFGRQMRSTLSRAHARLGDDRFSKGQYSGAYDEYVKGVAVSPKDPHLLDQLARLEKTAEGLLGGGCDQLTVAAHITRADPPSPAHDAAQKALAARCR
jgi:tetratricopeptide (TPR) repeat protein